MDNMRMTRGRGMAMATMIAMALCAHAQDDEATGGPCDQPTDQQIVKLLEEAAKEKNPSERHAKLKATQEIDAECTECLFQLGISAFNRSRARAGSYEASIKYFEQVKAKCPAYHADV